MVQGRLQGHLYAYHGNVLASSASTYGGVTSYTYSGTSLASGWTVTTSTNSATFTAGTSLWGISPAGSFLPPTFREVERLMFPERPAPQPLALTDGAERRARDLLLSCLTEEQRRTLERSDCFRCVSDLGEIFEITKRRVHGVFKLDARGIRTQEWCVTPFGEFPLYDVMLAQKLALETDSRALAARANIRDLVTGRYVSQADLQFSFGRQPDYLLQA